MFSHPINCDPTIIGEPDVQHVLFGMTIGEKLNLSPIENTLLANVLDIACGISNISPSFCC